jgi:hypothetical protein
MTPLGPALATAVCLALALVPTVMHTYADVRATDGRTAAAVAPRLDGMSSRPTDRRAEWVKKTFDSDDWMERRYAAKGGRDVLLFVTRSYDLKRLYHHPELAVAYGYDLRDAGTTPLPAMQDVPVHVLRADAPNASLALYALLYDDEFVADPYALQVRTAWTLLVRPRRPMTLFFAHDPAADPRIPLEAAPAAEVLFRAIRSFQAQGRAASG